MRFQKSIILLISMTVLNLNLLANVSNMDVEKVFEEECKVCHSSNHSGGIGSDIRPSAIAKKNAYQLVDAILNGNSFIKMPAFKDMFSQADALKMVDYLQHFKTKRPDILSLKAVKSSWRKLNDRVGFLRKYAKPVDVNQTTDICFVTERDAERVTFLDGTTGDILSRHSAGYAVHITVTNKKLPRYAYSISRSGLLTMFDLNSPGQQKIAEVKVGTDSRGLAVSPNGNYLLAGNYFPSGAVLLNALTLEPLKVYPTSNITNFDGKIADSRVSGVFDTPYGPYFAFALKDAGRVYIVDYYKAGFPVVGVISDIGKNIHNGFLNEGKEMGRYLFVASQGSDLIGVIDFKTKSLVSKIYMKPSSKPHVGQGASWYNKKLNQQLSATVNMNLGEVAIWDDNFDIIAEIPTSGAGLFISTSINTPYLWADNVVGGSENWNKIHLVNKQSLKLDRVITIGTSTGSITDAKTNKVIYQWDVPTITNKKGKEVIPRILHAEPANHGKWTMISEWNCNRIGIYDSKTGEFIKYIDGLITPTFTYSIEHRQTIPGA